MTKQIKDRVLAEKIVDTAKYRYVLAHCYDNVHQWAEIRRLPLEYLDTTAAIDGWQTVEVIA